MMQHTDALAFVCASTAPAPVPLCPEISLYQASALTPLWQATQATLDAWETSPFWAFPWAGGQAVARYLLDHPELVCGRRVLDFGSGSGLVAISAARAGAAYVAACDIDPLFAAALALNTARNGVTVAPMCESVLGQALDDIEVVLCGDIFYEQPLATSALDWFRALAKAGKLVLVGDPGRVYSPSGPELEVCASYLVPTSREIEGTAERQTVVLRVAGKAADREAAARTGPSP